MPNSYYSKWLKEHTHASCLKKISQRSEQGLENRKEVQGWPVKPSAERAVLGSQGFASLPSFLSICVGQIQKVTRCSSPLQSH